MVSRYLTAENHRELLAAASRRRKPEIEAMLRSHFPRPDVPEHIRPLREQPHLSAAGVGESDTNEFGAGRGAVPQAQTRVERGRVAPLSATRYHVEFTTTAQCRDKLERALDLMSHQNPNRSVAAAFERALDSLLRDLEKSKLGKAERPQKSRGVKHGDIARSTRRKVFERDGEQCTYVAASGRRCTARAFLELDHTKARALGGSGEADNLGVLCRPHNQFRAEQSFGKKYIQSRIHRRQRGLDVPDARYRETMGADSSELAPDDKGKAKCETGLWTDEIAVTTHKTPLKTQQSALCSGTPEASAPGALPLGSAPTSGFERQSAERTVAEKLYLALTTMGFRANETRATLAKLARQRALLEAPIESLLRDALALLLR